MEEDPERLSEDGAVSQSLRAALVAVRHARPDSETRERIARELGLENSAGPRARSPHPARGARFAIGAGGAILVLVFAWSLDREENAPVAESRPGIASPIAPTVRPEPYSPSGAAPETRAAPSSTQPRPELEPQESRTPQPPRRRAARGPRLTPSPALVPPTEPDLLGRAHAALARNPHTAWMLVGEHERLYPNGTMAQEREVVAIDALVRMGREAEARTRAARFSSRYPSSALRGRVDALVGRLER